MNSNQHTWQRIAVLLLSLVAVSGLNAQAPGVGYVFPPGGKTGTTVEVRLAGPDWTPDVRFLAHDPRVKIEVLGPPGNILFHEPPYWIGIKSSMGDPPVMREVRARLTIPADMPAGPIRWRVVNANGASNTGIFIVSHDNEVIENEARTQPQEISVPTVVSGRLRRIEEVDRYQFRCEQSGLLTCDLMARRLGSNFNGVIEVHDDRGRLIAEAVDTEGVDPTVTFAGQKDQSYTISLRDVDHKGFRSLTYRLSVVAGPRLLAALPAVGKRGETRDVEFVGIGLASGQPKLESVVRKVVFPSKTPDGDNRRFDYRLETPAGTSNPISLFLSDLPETIAADGNSEPMMLSVPQAVSGRFRKRDGTAIFRFEGKKGEEYRVSAEARRFRSPLDVALAIVAPDGKELASNDDIPGTTDAALTVKLPADGTYQIVLTDAAGVQPSPTSIYRVAVERQVENFSLSTLPLVNVPIGENAKLALTVVREGGFKEPIEIRVTGLPKGVAIPEKLVVTPKAAALAIPFSCDKDVPSVASFVTLEGTAKIGDSLVTRTATVPLAGDLAIHDPAAHRHSAVLLATTIKPPYTIKLVEADGGRRVHRGATHLAEVVIERQEGFSGAITLDMAGTQSRHSQGIRGPAFSVPAGADKVLYPVFLPEHVETTTTRRLALVAQAQVPDGTGKMHHVLAAMKGQITMSIEGALLKLSHQADELVGHAGQSFNVPLKLARSATLTAPVQIELVVPEELVGVIQADPIALDAKQDAAALKINTRPDARLQGSVTVHARATAQRDGHPVISETAIEIRLLSAAQVER